MLELADTTSLAHCMFEYVYFARPDSTIDEVNVYQTRLNIGKQLYEQFPIDADVIIPVPDSSIPAAIGYSRASGITYGEGLIKNRYVGRTFIMPTQEERELAVRLKLNPIKEAIKGKKIVLIDGHSILTRAFFGVPDLTNVDGLHTNAVYGFLNIMFTRCRRLNWRNDMELINPPYVVGFSAS